MTIGIILFSVNEDLLQLSSLFIVIFSLRILLILVAFVIILDFVLLSFLVVSIVASQSQGSHLYLFKNVLILSLLLEQKMFSHCVLINEFADDKKHFIFLEEGAVNMNGKLFT